MGSCLHTEVSICSNTGHFSTYSGYRLYRWNMHMGTGARVSDRVCENVSEDHSRTERSGCMSKWQGLGVCVGSGAFRSQTCQQVFEFSICCTCRVECGSCVLRSQETRCSSTTPGMEAASPLPQEQTDMWRLSARRRGDPMAAEVRFQSLSE